MISLVVATINRVTELDRLFCSLDRQRYKNFEVIVVDQNPDYRLMPVIAAHPTLAIRHLRSERGLSKARNMGLRCATGDLIAIPDDDCWYPEELLAQIRDWFASHPRYSSLSTRVLSEDGGTVGTNWPEHSCDCKKSNIFSCAVSCSIFFRREVYLEVGNFNEDIGVGAQTKFQSGEETDYVLRALALGFQQRFEPSLIVYHPKFQSLDRLRRITFSYALGSGYVLRAHNFPLPTVMLHLIKSLGGAVVNLVLGRIGLSRVYVLRAAGQLTGYLSADVRL
jgi:glycosyltransferase involved in cell wall biosynthesis